MTEGTGGKRAGGAGGNGNASGGSSGATGGSSGGSSGGLGGTSGGSGGGSGAGGNGGSVGAGGSSPAPDANPSDDSASGETAGPVKPEPGPVGDLASFKYVQPIAMDTMAAGVAGEVANYPVAVLLTDKNFNFDQTKPAGEDIRFGKADGTPLPYAIETWDKAGKSAAIWVKLDKVLGNNATQSFNMYWGKADAGDASDSTKVFSAADGFMAVYHLNEDGNNDPGGYKDSSDDPINGHGIAMAPGSAVPARVGKGTHLQNSRVNFKGQWITVDDPKAIDMFNADHPLTVSIWGIADTYQAQSKAGNYETVFSKGDHEWTIQRDYQGKFETCTNPGGCGPGPAAGTKVWYHFYLVLGKGTQAFYLNGKPATTSGNGGAKGVHPIGIGNQSQYGEKRQWDGIIDEARIMSVQRSADWIKLEYESQKEGSTFLKFGPVQTK